MTTLLLSLMLGAAPAEPLHVAPAVAERGEVKAGTPLSHTFTLRNDGATPLTIASVEGGCGCLRPRVSKALLPLGASAELALDVNTLASNAGVNVWKVTVRYEHGPEGQRATGEKEVYLKAKVVREVEVEPVSLFMAVEREATYTITVSDRRKTPLTVTAATCSAKHVRTQLTAADVDSRGRRYQQVRVTVRDDCPPGHHADEIVLTTDDPDYRELRVPLRVVRKAPGQVAATPEQLDLRLAKGQTSASGLVRLRDPDDQLVAVERVEADHPALRTKWAAGPGSAVTLRLGVEPGPNQPSGLGTVTVHLKGPNPKVIVVPVSWQGPE
jgi:hypothetical protein